MDRYGQHINDILARLKATGGSIPVVLVADPASRRRPGWRTPRRSRRLSQCQDVTQVEVFGPDLIEQPYGSATFTAGLTPEPTSLKEVLWSVTEPDGSPTDKAAISAEGRLSVNHRDGDVLVTATAADGSGAHGSKLVRIVLDAGLLRGNAVRWPIATVAVSSVYNSDFGAERLRDGAAGGEWASAGEQNPWVRVNWQRPVRADRIVLYDRAGIDDVNGGTLTFNDGSTVSVADVPRNGIPNTLTFDLKTFAWVRFQVEGGSGPNVGLAEFRGLRPPRTAGRPHPGVRVAGSGDGDGPVASSGVRRRDSADRVRGDPLPRRHGARTDHRGGDGHRGGRAGVVTRAVVPVHGARGQHGGAGTGILAHRTGDAGVTDRPAGRA